MKKLEESLLQQLPKEEVRPLLEPYLALTEDRDFWNHTLDGLAVLGAVWVLIRFAMENDTSSRLVKSIQ